MTAIIDLRGGNTGQPGQPDSGVDRSGIRGVRSRRRAVGGFNRGARGGRAARRGERYGGKGVLKAVEAVNGEIFDL